MPAAERPVTLLTDYGPGTEHVGALHLVLARSCPGAARIDLAHDIPPGDVRWGALTLARHGPSLPGAVHLAVVDPGVGGQRRALAVALADGGHAVGPDNGLLGPLVDAVGATAAADLGGLPPGAARTFHGRDLFAPAAARLAMGEPITSLGRPVPVADVVRPPLPPPEVAPGVVIAEIAGKDRFGNVSLLATWRDLVAAGLDRGPLSVGVDGAGDHAARPGTRFGDVEPGELVVYPDSNGALAVARRDADAADLIRGAPRSRLRIARG